MSMGDPSRGIFQEQALPPELLGRTAELIVYVDRSVIEVFVGDFALMSTRAYPLAGDLADMVGTFVVPGCADTM